MKKNEKSPQTPYSLTEKLKHGDLFAAPCPSRHILKHVSSQWGLLILLALREEEILRFSALRRKLSGVSEKMLSQSLRLLVDDGFIHRKAYPVVPPLVEYTLTEMGQEVSSHVATLADWIESNLPRVLEAQAVNSEPNHDRQN